MARGDYTGRCRKCGSNDLWDDNLAYGCNSCGAFLSTTNSPHITMPAGRMPNDFIENWGDDDNDD